MHRLFWTTRHVVFGASLVLAACGGDPSGPEYPQVAGTYVFTAEFDAFPQSQANVTGTLTVAQPDPDAGGLNILGQLQVVVGSDVGTISQFTSASVDASGRVLFQVPSSDIGTSWTFDGTLDAGGTRIQGRHTLQGSGSSFSGNWLAIRR